MAQQKYNFHDIVPSPDTWLWPEYPMYLGKLGLVRMLGHLPPSSLPKHDVALEIAVEMPVIPWSSHNGTPRPCINVFTKMMDVADNIKFNSREEREITFNFDARSYRNFIDDIPVNGDDTVGGNAYFLTLAVDALANHFFNQTDYKIMGTGIGLHQVTLKLTMKH